MPLRTATAEYAACDLAAGWASYRRTGWLITTGRLAARLPATGELISMWWDDMPGLDTDPAASTVTLHSASGHQHVFYGPGAAPIAVAAIAARLGPAALATGPALAWLRD